MEHKEKYYGDAYCVNCKVKVEFIGDIKVSDSGRRMAQGICPKCGNKVNRILGAVRNSPIPFASETKQFQPGVPIAPEPKTYASLYIYKTSKGRWRVEVADYRRSTSNRYEFFTGRYKRSTVNRAMQWLNAWEVIEFKEKC